MVYISYIKLQILYFILTKKVEKIWLEKKICPLFITNSTASIHLASEVVLSKNVALCAASCHVGPMCFLTTHLEGGNPRHLTSTTMVNYMLD